MEIGHFGIEQIFGIVVLIPAVDVADARRRRAGIGARVAAEGRISRVVALTPRVRVQVPRWRIVARLVDTIIRPPIGTVTVRVDGVLIPQLLASPLPVDRVFVGRARAVGQAAAERRRRRSVSTSACVTIPRVVVSVVRLAVDVERPVKARVLRCLGLHQPTTERGH